MTDIEQEFRDRIEQLRIDDAPDEQYRRALRRRVLTAFDWARSQGRRQPGLGGRVGRSIAMIARSTGGRAAVTAATLCVLGLIGWLVLDGGAEIALADVHTAMAEARTVTFKMSWQWGSDDVIESTMMYARPGKTRMEVPGMVSIIDWESGRLLALNTEAMTAHSAVVTDMSRQENPYHANWLAELEQVVGAADAADAGAKQIDGVPVRGWRVRRGEDDATVWADAATAELVQVQFVWPSGTAVMSDFVYNPPLDESLFSLTPPDQYRFHTMTTMKSTDPGLADVAMLLRIWASGNGGVFPDKIEPWKFQTVAQKADYSFIRSKKQYEQVNDQIGRAFYWLYSDARWTYAGRGVKVDTPDTPVFWVTPAEGVTTTQAIFADFSVREVAVGELTIDN